MERTRSRRRWLVLLAPVLAATGLILWWQARRPLDHVVQGCHVAADGSISTPADRECRVSFEDGTQMTLAKQTQGRIDALSYRRGASFALDHGQVDLAVVHRPSAQWNVAAGPFDVRVTGTRFAVGWTPSSQHFTLRVSEGEVRVKGCHQRPDTSVRAGQALEGDASRVCTNIEPSPAPAPPSPTVPVVHAQAPSPSRPEPAPASPARIENKRQAASSRLALRNLDVSGKAGRAEKPVTEPTPPQLTDRDWSVSSGLAPEIKPGPRRLSVGADGRLTGAAPGTLIAIGGDATRFSPPTGVMTDNLYLEDGALCTRGKIAALRCRDEKLPIMRCDWDFNWGVLIRWQPRGGQEWGDHAASSVALEFRGKSTRYRLIAHRQGDPADRIYCVDNYRSGRSVTPSQFTSQCWRGGGSPLPDFSQVDYFSLQVNSEETAQRFRFCVSAIDLR